MKKDKLHNILLIIALCLMTLSFFTVLYNSHRTPKIIEKRDTTIIRDTIWKDTTITEKELVPKIIVKKKVDTVYTDKGDTLHLVTESKMFDKRLIMAKDTADLQIYTTGINTSLDSLKWRLKTHNTHTTEIVEVIKYEEKKKRFIDRFHIGFQVGYGLGLKNRDFEPYVGFGGSMDL
jgi:hypothetical protein